MNWWRAHHGIATDAKYAVVQRHIASHCVTLRAPVTRAQIVSVWLWLLDFSSQNTPRGSIAGLEIDQIAVTLDIEDDTVKAILDGFEWKGMIASKYMTAFAKRQPVREDESAERTNRWRDRKKKLVTHGDAVVTHGDAVTLSRARKDEDEDEDEDGFVKREVVSKPEELVLDGRTPELNLPTQKTGHLNGKSSFRPSVPKPQTLTSERIAGMRDCLHDYMAMKGTGMDRRVKPPDDAIVMRCLNAIGEIQIQDAAMYLRDLFVNGEQSPRHASGPKSYAWFPPVLTEFAQKVNAR